MNQRSCSERQRAPYSCPQSSVDMPTIGPTFVFYMTGKAPIVTPLAASSLGSEAYQFIKAIQAHGFIPAQVDDRYPKKLGPRKWARPRGAPPLQTRQIFYHRRPGSVPC